MRSRPSSRHLSGLACFALVASLALLVPGPSRAGGYFLPDRGVRAISRGGAFVVGADDLSSLWYNPALLLGRAGTFVHTDIALIDYSLRYSPLPGAKGSSSSAAVENQAPPMVDPSIAFSTDLGLESFRFAIGVFAPYAGASRFRSDGAQRYATIQSQNLAFMLEAAVAWQPLPGLRLGAGLVLFNMLLNETLAVSTFAGLFGAPEDPDLDALAQLQLQDLMVPTANIGIWFSPAAFLPSLGGIELGFSVMPGFHLSATGELRLRLPENDFYSGASMDPEVPSMKASLDLPWIVRAGALYRGSQDRFNVELDFVWEGWSPRGPRGSSSARRRPGRSTANRFRGTRSPCASRPPGAGCPRSG